MHLSEKQQILIDNLRKFDPRLESIYLSAFNVLEDERNSDRIPQSAHSIREVLNVLSRLSGVPYKQKTNRLKRTANL